MLELNDDKFDVKWCGTIYSLDYPSVKDLRDLEKAKKETDNVDALMMFLQNAGLPEKVCAKLKVHHIEALVKGLTEVKKK